jgi:hypothetical protein
MAVQQGGFEQLITLILSDNILGIELGIASRPPLVLGQIQQGSHFGSRQRWVADELTQKQHVGWLGKREIECGVV